MSEQTTPIKLTLDVLNKYKTNPLNAIQEIIWNSIDGGAKTIKITINNNELGSIDSMTIEDDGDGFSTGDIQNDISNLSTSNKRNKTHSPEGRLYHGKRGEGVYKIAHLGDVTWHTSNGKQEIQCRIDFKNKQFVSDIIKTSGEKYTKIDIKSFNNTKGLGSNIQEDIILNSLISLKQYNISVYFNNILYDLKSLYADHKNYTITKTFKDTTSEIEIDIIELKKELPNSSKIIILAKDNTVIDTFTHQIKSLNSFPISIYMKFNKLDNDFKLTELNIERDVRDFAKEEIEKFKNKNKQGVKKEFLRKVQENNILPDKLTKKDEFLSPVEKEEKEVLEDILFKLYEYNKIDFDKQSEVKHSKLISELLSRSLVDDNVILLEVLQKVLDLKKEQLEGLRELLEHTSLSNMIKLSQEVTHRLKLLKYLEYLFCKGTEDNNKILERQQLQKLINENLWLLSEDFIFFVSDRSINSWAQQTVRTLKLDVSLELDDSGKDIPDYMICKKKKGRDSIYHHLIVEIKRPDYIAKRDKIGVETQDYMQKIIDNSPIDKTLSSWEMWFLVTDIQADVFPHMKDKQKGIYISTTHGGSNYVIYIRTWGELIQQKKSELEYLDKQLDLQVSTEDCRKYVLNRYSFMNISKQKRNTTKIAPTTEKVGIIP